MIGWKLFRLRKDDTLGSLFINRKAVLPPGKWLPAGAHRTKKFAFRPGWHVLEKPVAPHLSLRGRVWCRVRVADFVKVRRPESQGGAWLIAQRMNIIERQI